ncbi:cell division protein ZapA [Erythrobacter aquimaris]|uniref:Cell division protein ZapA n=1 Tax=Qipengyuania aquimaris TaxID=255984 RepID=A0A6I4TK48_9SPHN|nr:cell division protein ZapA [Qipengyuania aquimaris]MXO95371.1 cell division protein ZapA [Qipengyuania aquimaris]
MSDVKLTVGERSYTVSCADGQEQHVEHLAGMVDAKLKAMGGNLTANEAKNLLFAALMLADEVDEAGKKAPVEAAPAAANTDAGQGDAIAARLERLATAFENAASALEGGPAAS